MNKQRFSFYVTPEEIRSYFYQYDPNQKDKKDKIWIHSGIQADILLQLLGITWQKEKTKNSSEFRTEQITLTIKKSGNKSIFQCDQDLLLGVIAVTAMDKYRTIAQSNKKKNVRNIRTSSNTLSTILLDSFKNSLGEKMKNEQIKNNITNIFEEKKIALDLQDFALPCRYRVTYDLLERFNENSTPDGLFEELEYARDLREGWNSLKSFNEWKEARILEFPGEKQTIQMLSTEVEAGREPQISLMALEKVKDEIVLTFVNDRQQTFSLNRYQLIQLMEPEHRTKTLVPCFESDYQDNRRAVAEVIGVLDKQTGMLIIAEGEKGKPITPESGLVAKYEFGVDIEQLVSYYIVFEREWKDRLEFEHLLNKAKPEPCFDLLSN